MIYFDSAATTLQKPESVYAAVQRTMRACASVGRGGHAAADAAARVVYACRMVVSGLSIRLFCSEIPCRYMRCRFLSGKTFRHAAFKLCAVSQAQVYCNLPHLNCRPCTGDTYVV